MNKPVDAPLAPDLGLRWTHSLARLDDELRQSAHSAELSNSDRSGHSDHPVGPLGTRLRPTGLPQPYWVAASVDMARELGLDPDWLASDAGLQVFTGNMLAAGARPMATVYSGHQFGVWAGQLGDGRAILLGEVEHAGRQWEIQLKGSGLTPYSRMGDGRAVLRSSIREYLCSEAMHALGIPTTRALCVTGSDAPVMREEVETAAVVTRVAPSFIRFGHFEHFAANDRLVELRALADHVIGRFYPGARDAANPYADLLRQVADRTAAMVARWQAVGFCHGVMNTDNMSILGLTIDYGPFGFMDAFNPDHICNHSDPQGRYAYNRQPNIAYWNLFALAQALLPLIGDQDAALAALEPYKTTFPTELDRQFNAKLGLAQVLPGDREQVNALLKLLARDRVDWTIFWRRAYEARAAHANPAPVRDLFMDRDAFDAWSAGWQAHLTQTGREQDANLMRVNNPAVVLRNHLAETAIRHARQKDFSALARLHGILSQPWQDHADAPDATGFPPEWAQTLEVSCSS